MTNIKRPKTCPKYVWRTLNMRQRLALLVHDEAHARARSAARWNYAVDRIVDMLDGPEAEANARLIVEAPAMERVLRKAYDWLIAAEADEPEDYENPELRADIETISDILARLDEGRKL